MTTIQSAWEQYRDHFYPSDEREEGDEEYIEYLRTVFFEGAVAVFSSMNSIDTDNVLAISAVADTLESECYAFNEERLAESDK